MKSMPIEAKIANVKSDLIKYVEVSARDYKLPPFIMVGIIADILSDWKSRELVQLNDGINEMVKAFNNQILKDEGEETEDVQD